MTLIARRRVIGAIAGLAFALTACSDDDDGIGPIEPGDADIGADITSNRTLYADTTYTLTNYVHVANGATLTIEPGTVVKGRTGSALFIMRGGKIVANGRADAPIVFTSDQAPGSRKPGDWGGLVIIGAGVINRAGVVELEGTGTPVSNPAIDYGGGTDNADSSGVLRYVRIEFAGFGVATNQELNSLTLAAVGSRTRIEYVQTVAGLDDSYEWFGGAVDGKYLVSYESGDDHFDPSEGYVGRNQFLIAFQDSILPPRAGAGVASTDPQGFEVDGCGSATGSGCSQGYNSMPLNIPMFANFTIIGTGPTDQVAANSGGHGMVLRRGSGGYYVNGVIARFPRSAISLRDTETQTRATSGDLILRNISVVQVGTTAGTNGPIFEGGTACPAANCRFTVDAGANAIVAEAGATTAAAVFAGLPEQPTTATLDFSLVTGAVARTGGTGAFAAPLSTKGGTFITGTDYRGAWDPSGVRWWEGWTTFAQN
jgi:hypothetical protein